MATAKKKSTAKKTSRSKALTNWDEQLAQQAEAAAKMEESSGGGEFFSLKGGNISWQDADMPNNEMAVVILDVVMENIFYEGGYDPDVPQSPTCFAFGREEDEMEPHIIVKESGNAQSTEGCVNCENNEWGSAEIGKGKACRNTRRLALIPAGTFGRDGEFEPYEDVEDFQKATIGYMKIPVTSIKGYAGFVKQVSSALKRPPHGIFTRIATVPDDKTQFKVVFEALDKIPDELMPTIMERHEEAASLIEFPYTPYEEDDEPEPRPRSRRKPAAKKTAKKKTAKKKARRGRY